MIVGCRLDTLVHGRIWIWQGLMMTLPKCPNKDGWWAHQRKLSCSVLTRMFSFLRCDTWLVILCCHCALVVWELASMGLKTQVWGVHNGSHVWDRAVWLHGPGFFIDFLNQCLYMQVSPVGWPACNMQGLSSTKTRLDFQSLEKERHNVGISKKDLHGTLLVWNWTSQDAQPFVWSGSAMRPAKPIVGRIWTTLGASIFCDMHHHHHRHHDHHVHPCPRPLTWPYSNPYPHPFTLCRPL